MYGSQDTPAEARKPLNLYRIREMSAAGEKLAMLTCYDASFATLMDACGVDMLLIGDSLGMVIQGRASTLPVSMDALIYHTRQVVRGNKTAWVIADMPFGSYQTSTSDAIANAALLMQAGAQMVKLEGGGVWVQEIVSALVERGIPVCAHLRLTPQSVHAIGGYRIQGKEAESAAAMKAEAIALAKAGAALMVLELVPTTLANEITAAVAEYGCITIGIGAGPGCGGQVLVCYDMLGVTMGKLPRFVRNFKQGQPTIADGIKAYVSAVKEGSYPDPALHGY